MHPHRAASEGCHSGGHGIDSWLAGRIWRIWLPDEPTFCHPKNLCVYLGKMRRPGLVPRRIRNAAPQTRSITEEQKQWNKTDLLGPTARKSGQKWPGDAGVHRKGLRTRPPRVGQQVLWLHLETVVEALNVRRNE